MLSLTVDREKRRSDRRLIYGFPALRTAENRAPAQRVKSLRRIFSQIAVMDALPGLGIATMLIGVGAHRVRTHWLAFAALGVEDGNPRARRLYERLGSQAAGRSTHHGKSKTTTA